MYIIMELMLHGDLRGFLLGHRHLAEASLAGTPVSKEMQRAKDNYMSCPLGKPCSGQDFSKSTFVV